MDAGTRSLPETSHGNEPLRSPREDRGEASRALGFLSAPGEVMGKQSTKDCISHPAAPRANTEAPGQTGYCHPVPALGDTTATAPAPPAPLPGAQLRPRLPQAEVLRQLPERSHGPHGVRTRARLCPWAPVPPHAHACYTPAALATLRAPSAHGTGKGALRVRERETARDRRSLARNYLSDSPHHAPRQSLQFQG